MISIWYAFGTVWGIRILLNLLSYIHLWYVKEYRADRMRIHLGSPQGKKLFVIPWRRPPVTPKTLVIASGAAICLYGVYTVISGPVVLKFLVTDIVTFPIVSALVMLAKIPTFAYHQMLIGRAVAKLRAHTPMTVIGVTGSYGKTSTKEILATFLRQKYNILNTEASKNSPIAIAELVLKSLKSAHQVFIVEMGAYKKGEIRQMCAMVRPEIGVVTAINAQHQDLFGSIQNTIEAKYELIQGLTGRKIVVFNADDPRVNAMGKRAAKDGCVVVGYSKKGIPVRQTAGGLRFGSVSVRLFGVHQASNVLAAMAAAEAVGMTRAEITQASRAVRPLPHVMNPMEGVHGSRFIDDTFNNNPDAAMAALEYLDVQPGRRVLVFQPMIELGAFAQASHEAVARRAGEVASEIILTNESFASVFETYKQNARVSVLPPRLAALHLRKTVSRGDTVLFKGKEAGLVLQLLV